MRGLWLLLAVALLPGCGGVSSPPVTSATAPSSAGLLPDQATREAAAALREPVEVLLFYEHGCPVGDALEPYFSALAEASGGRLRWRRLDHLDDPALAAEYRVGRNGLLAFTWAKSSLVAVVSVPPTAEPEVIDRLHALVQEHLAATAAPLKTARVLGWDEAPEFLQRWLSLRGYEEQPWEGGALDGTDLVVLRATALPEGWGEPLGQYLDEGGELVLLGAPGATLPVELDGRLGVRFGEHPLVTRSTRQAVPDEFFGVAPRMAMALPHAARLLEQPGAARAWEASVRTPPETFEDVQGGGARGVSLTREPLVVRVTGPDSAPFRALVFGSEHVFDDARRVTQLLFEELAWMVPPQVSSSQLSGRDVPAAVRAPLWPEPLKVERVIYQLAESTLTLERRVDARGGYPWVTVTRDGEPASAHGNRLAEERLQGFTSPVVRRLKPVPGAELGFEEVAERLVVEAGGERYVLELGMQDGREQVARWGEQVFVLPNELRASMDLRWDEQSLHPFDDPEELKRLVAVGPWGEEVLHPIPYDVDPERAAALAEVAEHVLKRLPRKREPAAGRGPVVAELVFEGFRESWTVRFMANEDGDPPHLVDSEHLRQVVTPDLRATEALLEALQGL